MISRVRQYRIWMVPVAVIWLFWSSMAVCLAYSVSAAEDDAVMVDHSAHQAKNAATPSPNGVLCAGSPVDNQCQSCCDNVPESLLSVDQQLTPWLSAVWTYVFSTWPPAEINHALPSFELSSHYSPPDIFLWVCSFLK